MESRIREQLLVYLKKNKDYGDSFLNSLNKHGVLSYIIRAEDKISRLKNITQHGNIEVGDEQIIDTILDLFNYSVLCHVWEHTQTHNIVDIAICMNNFLDNRGERFIRYLISLELISENESEFIDLIINNL